jgi:hypothetical protein
LLPAVQKIREAANRMSCSNNMKQIVLGAHNYESSNGKLPPGVVGPVIGSAFTWAAPHNGVLTFLLPYVEQDNAFNQIDKFPLSAGMTFENDPKPGNFTTNPWFNSVNNRTVASYRIKTFVCPSDGKPVRGNPWVTLYASNTTFTGGYHPTYAGVFQKTNYASNAGFIGDSIYPQYNIYRGPFYNRSSESVGTIPDGSSNTVFFGEALGRTEGATDWTAESYISWFGGSCFATAWGLPDKSGWWTYGSAHPQIAMFAWGDGSVRPVRKGINIDPNAGTYTAQQLAWYYATGVADGGVVDYKLLSN